MTGNLANAGNNLRVSRQFPDKMPDLTQEINKAYIEIASAVNDRTSGIYPSTRPAITGNSWTIGSNRRQQTFRQIYSFTSSALTFAHGIDLTRIAGFVQIYGTFTDGTYWYPLPYVDVASATNQINIIVQTSNIVISKGAGAPPALTSGFVVLEWLSLISQTAND